MAIIVKGRNTVVSPAVKAYVEKKIDKVTRQFKAVGDITAVLKVENGNHIGGNYRSGQGHPVAGPGIDERYVFVHRSCH